MKRSDMMTLTMALLVIASGVMLYNAYALTTLGETTQTATVTVGKAAGIIPTGIPETYGEEIGVRYDDVSASDPRLADATIQRMSQYEPIELTPEQNARYSSILYTMHGGTSCEYCCGARSIIFENGQRACGCAHSFAMRGLAKYLITEHGDDYSDEEILTEVVKWKVLFFPTQMQAKADALEQNGIEPGYINLGSNLYRGIEKGVSGQMVGGC